MASYTFEPMPHADEHADASNDWRVDFATGGDMLPPVFREDGTAMLEGVFARPGIYEYLQPNGTTVRELVPPETLHDPKYLETVARSVLTLEHPRSDGTTPHVVNPDNYAKHSVGDVDGDIVIIEDTGFVRIKMAARRRDALDAIRRGVQELSPGYRCRIERTPGEDPTFGRYDAIQRDRRNNHVAIVERARGGRDCAFRADAAVQITHSTPEDATMEDLLKMLLALQLDGTTVKLDADTRLDAKMVRQIMEDMQGEIKTLKRDLEKANGANAGLQAQYDEMLAEKTAKADAEPTAEQVKADRLEHFGQRLALVQLATARKVDGVEKLDNDELRRAIVKSVTPDLKADASDDYVNAAFDIISKAAASKADGADPWASLRIDSKPKAKSDDEPAAPRVDGWRGMVQGQFNTPTSNK